MLVCIQTSSISIMTKPQTTLLHQGGHCDVMTTSCPDTPPSLHQHQEHDHQYHVPFKHCLLATIVATTTAAALPPTTTTPTPARKPGICHESSYSFSPIPIVLLSSVVIQFSSVTYEPAYELFLFRMLDLANTPTIIQNSNIIIMIMIYPSMIMPPTFSK